MHQAGEIIHAGDPDREEISLVDEVLLIISSFLPKAPAGAARCSINDLNPQASSVLSTGCGRTKRLCRCVSDGASASGLAVWH
ncbi:hypothetical protein KCP78_04820 [Salmonella enterica subsp. enterica]|nr:hypothetical protein KCP78_04820 [Salmonella enterica subsp. enterica]